MIIQSEREDGRGESRERSYQATTHQRDEEIQSMDREDQSSTSGTQEAAWFLPNTRCQGTV